MPVTSKTQTKTVNKVEPTTVTDKSEKPKIYSTSEAKKETKQNPVIKPEPVKPAPQIPQEVVPQKKVQPQRVPVDNSKFTVQSKFDQFEDAMVNYDTMETLPTFPDFSLDTKNESSFLSFIQNPAESIKATTAVSTEKVKPEEKKISTALTEKKSAVIRVTESNSTLKKPKLNELIETAKSSTKVWVSFVNLSKIQAVKSLIVEEKSMLSIFAFRGVAAFECSKSYERFNYFPYFKMAGRAIRIEVHESIKIEFAFKNQVIKNWLENYNFKEHFQENFITLAIKNNPADKTSLFKIISSHHNKNEAEVILTQLPFNEKMASESTFVRSLSDQLNVLDVQRIIDYQRSYRTNGYEDDYLAELQEKNKKGTK